LTREERGGGKITKKRKKTEVKGVAETKKSSKSKGQGDGEDQGRYRTRKKPQKGGIKEERFERKTKRTQQGREIDSLQQSKGRVGEGVRRTFHR